MNTTRVTTLATAFTAAMCLLLAIVQVNDQRMALFQKPKPHVNVWRQIGATEPSSEAKKVMAENDSVGYKAHIQQLAMKGANQRTTVWQQIGAPEPSQEAQNVMFQNDKVGYKANTQMLSEDKVPKVNVWKQIGVSEPSAAAIKIMSENDDAGYKSKTQMLAMKGANQRTTVWQQIGAPEPSKEAENVMFQNDKVGYKANTQMLAMKKRAGGNSNIFASKQPRNTVWRQIGAPDPADAAKKVMAENDQVGYKANTQMLSEQEAAPVNVWQQIGAQEPSDAANQVMDENDKVGY